MSSVTIHSIDNSLRILLSRKKITDIKQKTGEMKKSRMEWQNLEKLAFMEYLLSYFKHCARNF